MALRENIDHHWNEISRKRDVVDEALSWTVSGRNLKRESKDFSKSPVMKNLIKALADERGNPIDRFKMSQYLALSLEYDPNHNLQRFIAYLDKICEKSKSARRSEYYKGIRGAVASLSTSHELSGYMAVYEEFQNDKTKKATLARKLMHEVTSNTKKIMGEYV